MKFMHKVLYTHNLIILFLSFEGVFRGSVLHHGRKGQFSEDKKLKVMFPHQIFTEYNYYYNTFHSLVERASGR